MYEEKHGLPGGDLSLRRAWTYWGKNFFISLCKGRPLCRPSSLNFLNGSASFPAYSVWRGENRRRCRQGKGIGFALLRHCGPLFTDNCMLCGSFPGGFSALGIPFRRFCRPVLIIANSPFGIGRFLLSDSGFFAKNKGNPCPNRATSIIIKERYPDQTFLTKKKAVQIRAARQARRPGGR